MRVTPIPGISHAYDSWINHSAESRTKLGQLSTWVSQSKTFLLYTRVSRTKFDSSRQGYHITMMCMSIQITMYTNATTYTLSNICKRTHIPHADHIFFQIIWEHTFFIILTCSSYIYLNHMKATTNKLIIHWKHITLRKIIQHSMFIHNQAYKWAHKPTNAFK